MTNDEHFDGLLFVVRDAINGYLRHHSHSVRAAVVQGVLGELLADTFVQVASAEHRAELLDEFCRALRDGVEEMAADDAARAMKARLLQ